MGSLHQDVDNLAFFARFETCNNVTGSSISKSKQPRPIGSAIKRLTEYPGISNLEVVSYLEDGTLQYCIRLQTTWLAEDSSSDETHIFTYTGTQWIAYASELESEYTSWTALLEHLMDRASDRAYLHVRE